MIFMNNTESKSEEESSTARVMTFIATREMQGIESRFVTEIIGMKVLAKIPGMPSHIKGIIEIDGKKVPVIDVRKNQEHQKTEPYTLSCIVVMEISGTRIGLLADCVEDVIPAGAAASDAPQH